MFRSALILALLSWSCHQGPAAPQEEPAGDVKIPTEKTVTIFSGSKDIKAADVKISVQLPSKPAQVVWDGEEAYTIPDYKMESHWQVSYKDSAFAEFEHSRLSTTAPAPYQFIFNRNLDSTLSVQVIIKGEVMDYTEWIRLVPKESSR